MDIKAALERFGYKPKEFEGYSLLSLINVYWDESRNPNGNYETEEALVEGELRFCENMGLSLNEWIKYGTEKNK